MATTGTKQVLDMGKFIAQAFTIPTPEDIPGAYVTKVGLFFKAKDRLSQVKLFLVEMNNNVPDPTNMVSGTLVYKNSSNIKVSSNASVETVFQFEQPVFLSSTKEYAICLQTSSRVFSVWGAAKGEKDILTRKNLGSNPLLEKLYYRENNGSFSILENEDMKFNLYRAKFETGTQSVAVMRPKQNYEYLKLRADLSEKLKSIDPTGMEKVYRQGESGWDLVGDFVDIYKLNGADSETFIVVVDNTSTSVNFSGNDVIRIVREEFATANSQSVSNTGNISYTTQFSKVQTEFLRGTVESVKNWEYHSVFPRFDIEQKTGAFISFDMLGTKKIANTFIKDSDRMSISGAFEKSFYDASRWMPSKSNRSGIANPLEITAILSSENDFCAPIIRLNNSRALLVTNVLNSDEKVGLTETTNDGKGLARYVSSTITLAEGMDAEDLRVFVSAYKPNRTNVRVYGRFQNSEDTRTFLDLPWIELPQITSSSTFSDSRNTNNFIEFEYAADDINKSRGILRYQDENGAVYEGFKKYSIKIVLTADAGYEFNPPKITDLKVIALQR
jgi:hypothetical protein